MGRRAEKKLENPVEWAIITAKVRVDAFSHADFMQDVREARSNGIKNIALNLKTTRFLNLSAIKFCVELAQELADEGGRFALVACSERTKRHFEIYGSLNEVRLVRDVDELEIAPARKSAGPQTL